MTEATPFKPDREEGLDVKVGCGRDGPAKVRYWFRSVVIGAIAMPLHAIA